MLSRKYYYREALETKDGSDVIRHDIIIEKVCDIYLGPY